jgi:hypothetical protein
MEKTIEANIANRFGVLPNFFRLSSIDPTVAANLWGFAQFAYLDNPMPSLFKERLLYSSPGFVRSATALLATLDSWLALAAHPATRRVCPRP